MIATRIKEISLDYFNFMSEVGNTMAFEQCEETLLALFSEDIVKIENGSKILTGLMQLIEQLKNAQNYGAPWSMKLLDITCDESEQFAVIRFTWDSEKVGMHITAARLTISQDHKISAIDEVYNQFADITH